MSKEKILTKVGVGKMIDKNKEKIIQEEMNLCEFPFAALTTQKNFKTLKFSDVIDIKKGEEMTRVWNVEGSTSFGTPISVDDESLMVILSLTSDHYNIPIFSTYEFLKAAHWRTDGPHYKMFYDSMLRLAHATITTTDSFYDKEKNKYFNSHTFHIFDEVYLSGMATTGKEEIDRHIWDKSKNMVKLSKTIMDSMNKGNVKPTNLDFYLSLKSPVAKRLYRYLDKQFYKKNVIERNIKTLGFEHIGASRKYNLYELKRVLDRGLIELQQRGYLKQFIHWDNGVTRMERGAERKSISVTPSIVNAEIISQEIVNEAGDYVTAEGLVIYLHVKVGIDSKPTKLELDQAGRLIKDYGVVAAKFIVDYTLEKMSRSKSEIRVFGIVLTFEEGAIEQFRNNAVVVQRKAEESKKRKKIDDQESQAARSKELEEEELENYIRSLPAADQEDINRRVEKAILDDMELAGGHDKKYWMTNLNRQLKRYEIIKQELSKN